MGEGRAGPRGKGRPQGLALGAGPRSWPQELARGAGLLRRPLGSRQLWGWPAMRAMRMVEASASKWARGGLALGAGLLRRSLGPGWSRPTLIGASSFCLMNEEIIFVGYVHCLHIQLFTQVSAQHVSGESVSSVDGMHTGSSLPADGTSHQFLFLPLSQGNLLH